MTKGLQRVSSSENLKEDFLAAAATTKNNQQDKMEENNHQKDKDHHQHTKKEAQKKKKHRHHKHRKHHSKAKKQPAGQHVTPESAVPAASENANPREEEKEAVVVTPQTENAPSLHGPDEAETSPGVTHPDCRQSLRVAMDGSVRASSSSSSDIFSNNVLLQEQAVLPQNDFDGDSNKQREPEALEQFVGTEQASGLGNIEDKVMSNQTVRGTCCTGRITKRQCLVCLFLLLLAAAVAVTVVLILPSDDSNGIKRIKSQKRGAVLSDIPNDLCHEGVPGEGQDCQTLVGDGGRLCNILAQAVMKLTDSDMAIIPSGICTDHLRAPTVTAGDIMDAIELEQLATVEVSGQFILQALEDALDSTFGSSGQAESYPYAAGLRYNVEANLEFGERLSSAEIDFEHLGIWRPVVTKRFYKVATVVPVANGELGYNQFEDVIEQWRTTLNFNAGDALLNYILENPDWWELPLSDFSTQSYVGPLVEPTIATVDATFASTGPGDGTCNLVAWGLLDQYLQADIALFQSSYCGGLNPGVFDDSALIRLIPTDHALVLLRLEGSSILSILNDAVDASIDGNRAGAYPYAAGVRFVVDSTAPAGNRVSSVELMNRSNRWEPFNAGASYMVLTSENLAKGQDAAYNSFLEDGSIGDLRYTSDGSRETFYNYASEWSILYNPPREKHSTKLYIG